MSQKTYKSVGVLGGGTAGFFAALILKKNRPDLQVTLIESDKIPVTGVGEATTRIIIQFLHRDLGFELGEFFREVKPTWKQGIKFEWGLPGDYYFNYPFGLHESYASYCKDGHLNNGSLQSMLMSADKSFLLRTGTNVRAISSIASGNEYAYHLDNKKLIYFLRKKAKEFGVRLLNREVIDTTLSENGEEIVALLDTDGEQHSYDMYVDCSGFRSKLLEGVMKSAFVDYSSSLFTDRALVSTLNNGGHIKPYTTATTMNSGWMWNIPLRTEDHIGYVYSSSFCSDDEALKELSEKEPTLSSTRTVRFRSGRHQHCWKGNVVGIGNSYGFVEPLESTGIQMIISELKTILQHFPVHCNDEASKKKINSHLNQQWDHLRWFLAWHFHFNKKLQTPFWEAYKNEANVSGYQELLQVFREEGPLRKKQHFENQDLRSFLSDSLFRFNGFDNILLGQNELPNRPDEEYLQRNTEPLQRREIIWEEVTKRALEHKEALEIVEEQPELIEPYIHNDKK